MLILTCSAQLQRLEGALRRSLPFALPVYGAVMNINRGNPGNYEVVVDSWPKFGAVLARRRGEVCLWMTATGTPMQCSTRMWVPTGRCWRALGACAGTVPSTSSVAWAWGGTGGGHLGAGGTGEHWRHDLVWWSRHWRLDPRVQVTSLSPEHLDLLNKTWAYGGNSRSRSYLAELMDRFPHLCLKDGTGQPFCWVLTDQFGTGTHGYTLPTHRRRGYMQAALTLAAQRAQARGFPNFG
ncbi:GLYL3 protein, partial [Galbula dea]|nr:GLYL3 protein [Galbula dea]